MITPPETRVREAGLRVTKQRLAVLAVLDGATVRHEHLTVATLAERTRAQLGSVSTQAVYDCLAALTKAGLVRVIEPAGQPSRYETRVGDHHHHVVCRSCGDIADVDGVAGLEPCLTPPAISGFSVDTTEVTFWGVCRTCSAHSAPPVPHQREVSR